MIWESQNWLKMALQLLIGHLLLHSTLPNDTKKMKKIWTNLSSQKVPNPKSVSLYNDWSTTLIIVFLFPKEYIHVASFDISQCKVQPQAIR